MKESDTVVEEDERRLQCIPVKYTVKNYTVTFNFVMDILGKYGKKIAVKKEGKL